MAQLLPPLKPMPIKERLSVPYIEKGHLDVLDGAFVIVDKTGVRTHVPVGGIACLMLEPGTRVSHAACALAGRVGVFPARGDEPQRKIGGLRTG
jgi:CRISPR-associated protein Cas1